MGSVCALLYDLILAPFERLGLRRMRSQTVVAAQGRVLEVGVGTGLNLPFYGRASLVVAVDPDPAMLRRARGRALRSPAPVFLVQAKAEALPFPDASFDEIVGTLVFCTVGQPAQGFRELRRVLKPGGLLRLLEHVRSTQPLVSTTQDLITPVWSAIFGGCHPNRDTLGALMATGCTVRHLEHRLGDVLVRIEVTC